MSVAFRRDSDEEHLEPRFELPIPPGPNLVTAAGPALIAARIAALEAEIAAAADPEPLRRTLRYWHTRAATAEVAGAPADGTAGIATRVRFRLAGRERQVAIVGHDEADGDTRIAYAAPLARALIGLEAGDLADFQGRADAIEILSVEPL
ncbi:GreA/GreB family elongation factor [Sphingomonas rubra]|uniref:Transcription elongation factor, GreA/GreB family n=1 Tax=Sphingomonas rubra TaxID=634430 RepID=A0A1I5SXS6_9SPHN|nr:GreA/GreB family elongation factor [Sphingomonas rubra]SFP75550.1 Transcription elongation factor, GreA/GreB family [Sphingomonas rubra]